MINSIKNKININKIPKAVIWVCEELSKNNFESFLVGGCVRDLILNREPKDWDITTDANPEEIIRIFGEEETVYENNFGTVGVKIRENLKNELGKEVENVKIIEVTTYRKESEYEDFRRPSKLEWGKTVKEDLKRRDFTMNAMAYNALKGELIDIYGGEKDIENKIINTVGDPEERFNEDALRMLRAVRFSAELDFVIEAEVFKTIFKLKDNLANISKERIRDEFIKIINSKNAMSGLILCHKLGILKYISEDLESSVGITQNGHHTYDVFEHLLRSLDYATQKNYDLDTKIAALFHDIGKPATRRFDKAKQDYTFYGHEVVGAKMTKKILENLKFEKKIIERVVALVRYHMFLSDPEQVTLSAVRRLIVNIGRENIWDLINLRICDRMGSGTKKEEPYRLRKFEAMIDEALRDEISLKNLKINGEQIMKVLDEKPGRKIGLILNALFEEVIDEAKKNNEEYLVNRVKELNKLSEKKLIELAEKGKEKMENKNEEEVDKIKQKFKVK